MIPIKQRFRHDPDNGIWGDCHRAAVASVLELTLDDVPHFCEGGGSQETSTKREREWLATRGLVPISISINQDIALDDVLSFVERINPGIVFVLGGTSRTGCNHSVVCTNGKIAHDPGLDDPGIVGPCDDGFYWLTFFGAIVATQPQL